MDNLLKLHISGLAVLVLFLLVFKWRRGADPWLVAGPALTSRLVNFSQTAANDKVARGYPG